MKLATWTTWDEPGRQVAVAHWRERDLAVVFPLPWAARHGQHAMIVRAKERIAEVEGTSGRALVPSSVLLAFSRHQPQVREATLDPEIPAHLLATDE